MCHQTAVKPGAFLHSGGHVFLAHAQLAEQQAVYASLSLLGGIDMAQVCVQRYWPASEGCIPPQGPAGRDGRLSRTIVAEQ
ncbi:hypothetical protein D7319_00055 [Streptomyces radicis]|uniref:Uncharacterized protein n=1 Tax=Streptomyces radicis TaxID=1750517 RepID=A0A3A9WHV3_9ACTN|nr:hypothetical protein D7319_00055 [Streptomyces radicis]RKN27820.1 hypothetical protein D7318_02835 [Streptomyces radicis]